MILFDLNDPQECHASIYKMPKYQDSSTKLHSVTLQTLLTLIYRRTQKSHGKKTTIYCEIHTKHINSDKLPNQMQQFHKFIT